MGSLSTGSGPDRRDVTGMTPTLQLVLVGIVVAVAAVAVARSLWRTWFGSGTRGCGAGCGQCSSPAEKPPPEGRFPLPQL
jgi:hypothetical protein